MKKSTLLMSLIAVCLLFAVNKTQAQDTLIYSQNFDSSYTDLPTGWATTPNGWAADTAISNSSVGQYTGASGGTNIVIKNSSASGLYDLITNSISTLNDSAINVTWAARLTKNFPTPGSYVKGFYMSVDGGTTWDSIPYAENNTPGSSPWLVDNNGDSIVLPTKANNQPSVMFKWSVNIVTNANGTYRIDDFKVSGTAYTVSVPTGITATSFDQSVKVYSNNSTAINVVINDMGTERYTIDVVNILGEVVARTVASSSTTVINAANLSTGAYLVRVSNGSAATVSKIVLTK